MLTPLPDIETVKRVYELIELGYTQEEAALVVGKTRDQIKNWINKPELWSPFLDEIALERALNGDKAVYDRLSNYERAEFWKRDRALAEREVKYVFTGNGDGSGWPNPRTKFVAKMLGLALKDINQYRLRWADR